MTLRELQVTCYEQAKAKGWVNASQPVPIPEQVALLHSEISEAFEAWRENQPTSWSNRDKNNKPEGLASEYADVIIRIGHYATALGIDLEFEVERKLAFNLTREFRHGGKQA